MRLSDWYYNEYVLLCMSKLKYSFSWWNSNGVSLGLWNFDQINFAWWNSNETCFAWWNSNYIWFAFCILNEKISKGHVRSHNFWVSKLVLTSPLDRISAHYLLPTRFVVVGSRRLSRSNVGGGLGTRFHFILKLTRTKLAEVT